MTDTGKDSESADQRVVAAGNSALSQLCLSWAAEHFEDDDIGKVATCVCNRVTSLARMYTNWERVLSRSYRTSRISSRANPKKESIACGA